MGKTPKIHFSEHRDGPLWETACGRFEVTATSKIELVTCKKCLKRLHVTPVDIQGEVIGTFQEIEPLRCPESGLPVLTRDTYPRRDCKCGHCDVCRHFAHIKIDHEVAPWKDRPRLHRQKRFRWPSVAKALEWYADSAADGYPEPSLGESLMRLGRMGTVIQGGDCSENQAQRMAEDRALIEKALTEANTETGAAKALFLASVGRRHYLKKQVAWVPVPFEELAEAMNISSQAVKNLVKRTRMRFRAAMIELEALPPPKVPG